MEGRDFATPEEAQAFMREQMSARKAAPRTAQTAQQRAAELVYEANGYDGRMRSALARRALAEWADCADAWVILAEEMPDDDLALERYREGLEAGERALGPEVFAENAGHFWSLIETRPYMRARTGMADVLLAAGEVDRAFAHLRELLRLDEGDHQGLRYVFVPALLENGRFTEARELLESFEDDDGPTLAWSRLLVEFAERGDGPSTQAALAEARRSNPHVAKYLAGSSPLPGTEPPTSRPGSDDEGRQVALELLGAFEAVEGALDWLREARKQAKKEGKAKRRKH
jgi:tetratricopeptide (TPR) repeat protein